MRKAPIMLIQPSPNPFMALLALGLVVAYLALDLYFDVTRAVPTLTALVRRWAIQFGPWPQTAFWIVVVVSWIHLFICKE